MEEIVRGLKNERDHLEIWGHIIKENYKRRKFKKHFPSGVTKSWTIMVLMVYKCHSLGVEKRGGDVLRLMTNKLDHFYAPGSLWKEFEKPIPSTTHPLCLISLKTQRPKLFSRYIISMGVNQSLNNVIYHKPALHHVPAPSQSKHTTQHEINLSRRWLKPILTASRAVKRNYTRSFPFWTAYCFFM